MKAQLDAKAILPTMKVQLDTEAILPTRAYPQDAGMDLYSREDVVLRPGDSWVFDTGVHVEIPVGYYGKLESKSGLMTREGVICPGGVIDAGYSGSIAVMLYNLGYEVYNIHKGNKICQMIIMPCITPELEISEISSGERGEAGFGSTGK